MRLGTLGIDDEHLELHAAARRWVDRHVDPVATKALLDAPADGRPAFWEDLVSLGWLGLHVEEVHGGQGFGLVELAVVLEELGRAVTPGPFLPTVLASAVVQALGTDDQRAVLLPALVDGSTTAAVALFDGTACRGEGSARGLLVTGRVGPVLGGSLADLVVVPVEVDGGLEWCVLRRDGEGVELVDRPSTDATRSVADVVATAAPVGSVDRLARPRAAVIVADLAATLVAAESVGQMSWCVETAAAYAAVREQFGRPIGQFQAVKHRCADMLLRLEQARAAAWDAARGGGDEAELELAACVAGALVPDAALEVAKDCIQVLGGIGYTWDHDAHLYAKRALAQRELLGGPAPWRARVARLAVEGTRRSLRVELPAAAEAHRSDVRAFVAELQDAPKGEWNRRLADAGYLQPAWPAPWGRDAGPVEQLVIDEELAAARIRRPHLQVGAWVLPTVIAHGTPDQQERFVRPTLHGELLWCQLFSEPGAGSDLAALSTRAVRDDGARGWRLTGQKVWTTMAHLAQWGICLARSNPDASKHEGITCFLVDMASAGVDVRPLRELTGAELFNEVFLDDVFVPDDCVVGPVDGGWEVARTTLANERVSMGSGSSFGPGLEAVVRLVGERSGADGGPLTDAAVLATPAAVVADALGALVADGQSVAVLGLRATLRALSGAEPGAESSVRKLLGVEHEQAVQEAGLALLGPAAAATDGEALLWVNGFLGNRALSIAGGTSDVQRNVVAERLLDLPKDP